MHTTFNFGPFLFAAVFVKESDVATFTVCAIDDTRTLNKVLYLRPSGNVYSQNELTEIWEVKIGKKLEKIHVTEEQLLKSIHGELKNTHFRLSFISDLLYSLTFLLQYIHKFQRPHFRAT